jgi:hypothetical protein
MILDTIRTVATQFQIDNNLDRTEIPNLLKHDYIHATLGLMVSQAEEELVEAIEGILDHGMTYNNKALKLARSLPAEFRSLYKYGSI